MTILNEHNGNTNHIWIHLWYSKSSSDFPEQSCLSSSTNKITSRDISRHSTNHFSRRDFNVLLITEQDMFDNNTNTDMFENKTLEQKIENNGTANEDEIWSIVDNIWWYCHILIIPCISLFGLAGKKIILFYFVWYSFIFFVLFHFILFFIPFYIIPFYTISFHFILSYFILF